MPDNTPTKRDAGLKALLLSVENLRFSYDPESIRGRENNFTLSIPRLDLYTGELVGIIGPNGSGKTTLLKLLAGLLLPQEGTLRFNGHPFPNGMVATINSRSHLLVYHRQIGFIPQRVVLYNRSVSENVSLGLKIRGYPEEAIKQMTGEILARLKIAHLSGRRALTVSGGEARRIMLARALVIKPQILFLDEPFSDLDRQVKTEIQQDLSALLRQSGCTALLVTHNYDEAYQVAERFIVLMNGQVVQDGNAGEVFGAPRQPEIAAIVGIRNIFPAVVAETEADMVRLSLKACSDPALAGESKGVNFWAVGKSAPGGKVVAYVLPETIVISARSGGAPVCRANLTASELAQAGGTGRPESTSARNSLDATVKTITPGQHFAWVDLDIAGLNITACVTHQSIYSLGLAPGKAVTVLIKATAVKFIER